MLRQVFFVLQRTFADGAEKFLASLLEDLSAHGVGTDMLSPDVMLRADGQGAYVPGRRSVAEADILYVTDSGSCYDLLRETGRHVLVYMHAGNYGAVFKDARYVIEKIEELDYEGMDTAYRRIAGLPCDILATQRCIVRETRVEDADYFYEIYKEPSVTRYMEGLPADRAEEAARIQDEIKYVYPFYGYGMWTVLLKESGQVIGRAGVIWREGFDVPELGFLIGTPWQRQGYAYEVCDAILAYVKDRFGLMQIQTLVMAGNEKSDSLCRKLGFEAVGEITLKGTPCTRYLMGG